MNAILKQQFLDLDYLADELPDSSTFDTDLHQFLRLARQLRDNLYRSTDNPEILEELDHLPDLEPEQHIRSFLEQLLPKSARDMVGNYRNKQKLLEQVGEIARAFDYLHRLLDEDADTV